MKTLLAVALCAPILVNAAAFDCTTKASKLTSNAELIKQVKVDEAAAKKIALDTVNTAGSTIAKGGLEVENGCLVYSYDVKMPGNAGVKEVIIDAGNGKVLATETEGPRK